MHPYVLWALGFIALGPTYICYFFGLSFCTIHLFPHTASAYSFSSPISSLLVHLGPLMVFSGFSLSCSTCLRSRVLGKSGELWSTELGWPVSGEKKKKCSHRFPRRRYVNILWFLDRILSEAQTAPFPCGCPSQVRGVVDQTRTEQQNVGR